MPSPDGTTASLDPVTALRDVVARALAEDLGTHGDVTSRACVATATRGRAQVVARRAGTLAGLDALPETYRQVDGAVAVAVLAADGARVEAGTVIAQVDGPLRSVLTGERTALNLVGHLSGVATTTAAYVEAVAGTGCAVRDTRKTTPGLRLLEKAAVAAGGGQNHRFGLHDALLVKDNHIAAAGGVEHATRRALAGGERRPVQVEVRSLDEARTAFAAGATDLLLDNLDPAGVREIVDALGGEVRLEASGGMTLDALRAYAGTGVEAVSVGALTHSASWLDVAMDVVAVDGAA